MSIFTFLKTKLFSKNEIQRHVLFYRDFKGFTGGHLKVWDYFQHLSSVDRYKPEIFFTKDSSWLNNPWLNLKHICLNSWNPENTDILFLAGMDWLSLTKQQRETPPVKVINFIQHVRHADCNHPLYEFLKYPAIRICVSQQVADAIINTGEVNGPVFVNTNGLDFSSLPVPLDDDFKDIPILIAGLKNPQLGNKISEKLLNENIQHKLVTEAYPREEFLSLVNRSVIVVFLPTITEGFYLPALEAMYLGGLVVCPDCIGNRSFCLNNKTCLKPVYDFQNIMKTIYNALEINDAIKAEIIVAAKKISLKHSLIKERKKFLGIIDSLPS